MIRIEEYLKLVESGRNYHKFLVDGDYSDILLNILRRFEKFY